MRSGNPTLRQFERPQRWDELESTPNVSSDADIKASPVAKRMTLSGTVLATGTLVGLCAASAIASFAYFESWLAAGEFGKIIPWIIGGGIGAFVLAMVMAFKPTTARFVSPVYAILEGVFLAALSLMIAGRYLGADEATGGASGEMMGLIYQAIVLTFGIAAGMLLAYGSGLVRLGNTAIKIIMTAVAGVMVYAVALILLNGVFGMNLPNLWASASPLGIGFSALMVVLASVFLVLDFQVIDDAIKAGAPKHMEWYAGFSVLATLAWIYIEVLRLLAKLRSSD